jgi:hypothetical protein
LDGGGAGRDSSARWPQPAASLAEHPKLIGFLVMKKQRKLFFFEKKNQKTFISLGARCRNHSVHVGTALKTKVFCFFFSKKKRLP